MTLNENDRVKTLVEKDGFPADTIGVVASIYEGGPGCEVEVWDDEDYPADVMTFNMSELEKLD